jgi:hypothetical protein
VDAQESLILTRGLHLRYDSVVVIQALPVSMELVVRLVLYAHHRFPELSVGAETNGGTRLQLHVYVNLRVFNTLGGPCVELNLELVPFGWLFDGHEQFVLVRQLIHKCVVKKLLPIIREDLV